MAESNNTEDANPVVKEIPVFLSKRLAENLFIFKYPLRAAKDGYDSATILKSAIKPENQDVQLEVELNTFSINYDHFKGEQIANNANMPSRHDKEDEERFFDGDLMDKIVLQSTRSKPPSRNNFAIGVYQDGELHLTPLAGVIELRPVFNYFDKPDKRSKDDNKDETEEEEEAAKQVSVIFARQKPEHLKKLQEQSFKSQTTKSYEEAWIHTKYMPPTSSKAELTKMEMFCPSVDHAMNTLNMSKEEFLKALLPSMAQDPTVAAKLPENMLSINDIRCLPLIDQLRYLMKYAKVMSFAELRNTLSMDHDSGAVLKYLQQVAVLVKGNWIVNSELLYPKDTTSHEHGIPAELMCRARDFILLKFTENEYILRKVISSEVKLPSEELTEILSHLAKHQAKKGWQLFRTPDIEFCRRFPDIAERQKLLWEAKRKHLQETMQVHAPQRQRRKSNRDSVCSENEEKPTGRGKKSLRDSSISDNDSASETIKIKKANRPRKVSETT
ncbi:DNA-directed RNA polymerase III subunit RPC5 [Belonocnema kinseyi]|uniref:DNA-directed RNA polymerase III subunit RPC5 n=1 Tax=Belonocnema kinseyi TaxID=2817044 RepID=UPI00143CE05E|nr:DNA-directed RNA polymerase III subunit RPC5 [Belonocnema kinseyi]